jgi:hypothetical protein
MTENKYEDHYIHRLPSYQEAIEIETSELSKIRLEIEYKIRLEIEDKIRLEMENKIRSELEQKIKKDIIKQEFEDTKKKLQEEAIERIRKHWNGSEYLKIRNSLVDLFQKEKVIYYAIINDQETYEISQQTSYNSPITTFLQSTLLCFSETNVMMITLLRDKNIYDNYVIEKRPIYMFYSELNSCYLKILDQIIGTNSYFYENHSLLGKISGTHIKLCTYSVYSGKIGPYIYKNPSNYDSNSEPLETIIRLIPGGYKNGKWRPLNGFFGSYFNEDTLEILPCPPIIE